MPAEGCTFCKPYAFLFRVIKGVGYCDECGRQISDEELGIVSRVPNAPRTPNNSFEKGIRTDDRGLPYLDENGQPLKMKESFNPRDYGESPVVLPRGVS